MQDYIAHRAKRFLVILPWWLGLIICLTLPTLGGAVEEGTPCTPEPTDMFIEYGDLITCSIEPIGDTDVFRFSGSAGETVVVQAVQLSGDIEPCLQLFAPDSTSLQQCYYSDSIRIDATLNQTGTHTILVWDYANNRMGGYTLVLERVVPPSSTARPIRYSESIDDEINPVGDMDLFSFEGTMGDTITVQAVQLSGDIEPCLQLFAPDSTSLQQCYYSDSIRIDATLNQTGTHTILVWDYANNRTGGYTLALQCLAGPCVIGAPGIFISPPSGHYVTTQGFDLTLIFRSAGLSIVGGRATFDGSDVTAALISCIKPGTLLSGGQTFRCPGLKGGSLGTGIHTFSVTLDLNDGSSVNDNVTWEVLSNTEP